MSIKFEQHFRNAYSLLGVTIPSLQERIINAETALTSSKTKITTQNIFLVVITNLQRNPHEQGNDNPSFQGFKAKAKPIFAVLSKDLVSTSPENVIKDFGLHSCWSKAANFPWLFKRAFTVVKVSNS